MFSTAPADPSRSSRDQPNYRAAASFHSSVTSSQCSSSMRLQAVPWLFVIRCAHGNESADEMIARYKSGGSPGAKLDATFLQRFGRRGYILDRNDRWRFHFAPPIIPGRSSSGDAKNLKIFISKEGEQRPPQARPLFCLSLSPISQCATMRAISSVLPP